ncbi:MAG: OsmC family protein [Acetobacteraceae bacterium]|nr:OsmC family protein [Acetobacteraceae bacterium]
MTDAPASAAATIRGDVIFDAAGRNTGGFRNEVTVSRPNGLPGEVYELPTDEGPGHGGNSSAPYPLAYFTSALTACVMVQLRAFARRMRIEVQDINVNTRCHWERVQQGSAPYVSAPVAFTMDIELGPDVAEADQRRLLAAAEKGCFIEAALKPGVMRHRLKIKDHWVEVRSAP